MSGARWTIYWNEYSSDTYLYGSEITFHEKDVIEAYRQKSEEVQAMVDKMLDVERPVTESQAKKIG